MKLKQTLTRSCHVSFRIRFYRFCCRNRKRIHAVRRIFRYIAQLWDNDAMELERRVGHRLTFADRRGIYGKQKLTVVDLLNISFLYVYNNDFVI